LTKLASGTIGFSGNKYREPPPLGGGVVVGRRTGPGVVQGPARVAAGTPVFALPAGGLRWAIVRDGEAELEVVITPGSERAQVLRAPSFPILHYAWVPRAAVHVLPAKPGP
jgi:hypothetical protein